MENKEYWKRYLSSYKEDLMLEIRDPNTKKNVWWSMKYAETLYESPKIYNSNGLAFNNGNWLRFPKEYRSKNGRPKAIFLKDTKAVIKEIAFFCRFQRLLGVSLKEELVYHMLCFLCNVVKIHCGAFEFNKANREILGKIADNILNTEVKQEVLEKLEDNRSFCISQEKLKHMDKNAKARMQAKGRKMSNYFRILEKYDENKSISQNATICDVCISTIKRFKIHKDEIKKYIEEYKSIQDK